MRVYNSVSVTEDDDFLYHYLIDLLHAIRLTRGGTDLAYTLRNHPKIRDYLVSKQRRALQHVEDLYFNDDGSLNSSSVADFRYKIYRNKSCKH